MKRKEFIKMCGLLGVGFPIQTALSSCRTESISEPPGKVVIIGAGAAGLSAAYLLNQRGVEVEVLEASDAHGGRMKRNTDFADFPIPLGAEWLHVEREVLDEIVNDSSIEVDINTTPYNPDVDFGLFEGIEISVEDVGFTIDQKFINATWFDFFEQYVVPTVRDKITYNKVIESIDYSDNQILVSTANEQFTADRVIVTIPVKMLQNSTIKFIPELPKEKLEAIDKVTVWDGCKAFIEFSEKFYPTFTAFDITPESAGQKLYYDAAYGQNSSANVLGLFAVGTGTLPYVQLSDAELIDYMLSELDQLFEGKASASYVKHIFQNWNEEPFANGAYVYDDENWRRVRTLGKSLEGKLYFAGDAYTTGEDWSSVHTAARSARRAVDEIMG